MNVLNWVAEHDMLAIIILVIVCATIVEVAWTISRREVK